MKKLLAIVALLLLIVLKSTWPVNQATVQTATQSTSTPAPSPTPRTYDQAEPIKEVWPNYFTFVEHSIPERSRDEHGYNLDVQYPQIASAEPEARRFNRWIKNKVLGEANKFRRLADAEQRRKHKQPPALWGLGLYYVVYYSNERFVSLRLTHSVMEAGQMHPIAYYETINFDLKKGRQLYAKDVFKRGYLKQLSRASRKQLYTFSGLDASWIDRGTEPEVDNFRNWNLVPDGVLLSFEDYQVGPHSFGQPELVLPFTALRGTQQQSALDKLFASNKPVK
ncbi:MAG TPA: RsiV family protein [Pyrinomonadaceae bacterium]|nr:RsiV family protein [Pyrinomonadaceae bacterium]